MYTVKMGSFEASFDLFQSSAECINVIDQLSKLLFRHALSLLNRQKIMSPHYIVYV